ncbi:MAG: hypothetical protein Q9167_005428, partial [Letrouitia subvulpina]
MDTEATAKMAKSNAAQLDEEEKRVLECLAQVFHRDKRRENRTLLVTLTIENWTSFTSWRNRSHVHIKDELHQENNAPLPLMAWPAGPLPSIILTYQDRVGRDILLQDLRHANQDLADRGFNSPLTFKSYQIGNQTKNVLWSVNLADGENMPTIPQLLVALEDLLPTPSNVPVYLVQQQAFNGSLPVNIGDSPDWAIKAVAEQDCPYCRATVAGQTIAPPPPPPPILPPPVSATA